MLLNGFEVILPDELDIVVCRLPNPGDVRAERERLAGYWFVHWSRGELHCLRIKPGGPNLSGTPRRRPARECLPLLRARVDDVISSVFDKYTALRYRPFTFLAQRDEIVAAAAARAGIRHPLLCGFTIHPKYSLQAKVIETRDGLVKLGLFVEIGMRHGVDASLHDLVEAGVELSGLWVLRRQLNEGERRLAGRISSVTGNIARLEDTSGGAEIPMGDLRLEGSLESFARCLRTLLGTRYEGFRAAVDDIEAGFRVGPALDGIVERMGDFLRRKSPVTLATGVQASVGSRLAIENTLDTVSIYTAPPVAYVYDRSGSKRNEYAWRGLQAHGPYDRATFAKKSPRILVLYPDVAEGKVDAFLRALRDGIASGRAFPSGFAKTFGLLNPEFLRCPVRVFGGSRTAEAAYREAAAAFLERDSGIDAGIVALLDEHAHLPILQNPYYRSKALLLTLGIPTQQIRLQTLTQCPGSLQYTLQNFCIALYAKLNGTPWTVDQDRAITDEVVLGMGVAELSGSRIESRQRFVGITTVFSGDGTYLLGNMSRECAYGDYEDALRTSMAATLGEVRKRNGWQPGDTVRVIFHAHKPLKRDEVAAIAFDCARAVGSELTLQMAFLTVSHDHPFYLFDPEQRGIPAQSGGGPMKGVMAPERGTIARIGRWTRLVAINSPRLVKRPNSPLPKPLLISLHEDSSFFDLDYLAEQALKFTSLSWRSTLPAGTPVTVYYSERIANLLVRLRQVPDWSAAALSVKLRWSRWFL